MPSSFSEEELDQFARELMRQPSKAEAYRAVFPLRCKGLSSAAIGRRAWKLAEKGEIKAKLRDFASARDEERRKAARDAIIEIDEFRETLTRLFRNAAIDGNVGDAVKVGALLADVCGFRVQEDKAPTIGRFEISAEEVNAIIAG